jgi:predicted enzyme related to lactoylglutathione lyase
MGNPVVHFEVIGKDADSLRRYYGELFGWEFDADNSMNYGIVSAEANPAPEGLSSIGGGVATGPEGYEGHVTFYVGVPDVGAALDKAESLGGTRVFGPDEIMDRMILGQFKDPEGHLIGLVSGTM